MSGAFLIRHKDGLYLCQRPDSKWGKTDDVFQALQMDFVKANNICENCFPAEEKEEWAVVYNVFSTENLEKDDSPSEFDWVELACTQQQIFQRINLYGQELRLKLSAYDRMVTDIEHYIEFSSLNAAEGYKAYKRLKKILKKRRFIKNEIAKTSYFLETTAKDLCDGKLLNKIEGLNKRVYKPRVLTGLFGESAIKLLPRTTDEENKTFSGEDIAV